MTAMTIHPTAIVGKEVEIGNSCSIGPYAVIEGRVVLGDGTSVGPGTIITGNTVIGKGNEIHGHVNIGDLPQDVSFRGAETFVRIGDNNIFREYVTVHRGTKEGSTTIIGDNNFLMVSSHVGHNCRLGNNIILVNYVGLAGYVEIQDHAFISGLTGVHQFVRIGSYAICGFLSKINKDIPPFMMVDGNPPLVRGLNLVGLKRKGFSADRRETIKKAYTILYRSGNSISRSLEELENMQQPPGDDLKLLIDFIKGSKRGILLKSPGGAHSESKEE
jgi:UDP-N-acetylglucosamine acyltransferase